MVVDVDLHSDGDTIANDTDDTRSTGRGGGEGVGAGNDLGGVLADVTDNGGGVEVGRAGGSGPEVGEASADLSDGVRGHPLACRASGRVGDGVGLGESAGHAASDGSRCAHQERGGGGDWED